MDLVLSVSLGIGLSAASGFRVFVPLLIMSVVSQTGGLQLTPEFAWIGTPLALIAFAVATLIEVGGYFIPWLDNLLDTIATPAAIVAGVIVTAAVLTDVDPLIRWALAIIAGGGAAGVVQSLTVVTRATSSGTTGGCANPLVSALELIGSAVLAVLAIALPLLAGAAVLVLIVAAVRMASRRMRRTDRRGA